VEGGSATVDKASVLLLLLLLRFIHHHNQPTIRADITIPNANATFPGVVRPEAAAGLEVGEAVSVVMEVGEEVDGVVDIFAAEGDALEGEAAKDCKTCTTEVVVDVASSAAEVAVIVMLLLLSIAVFRFQDESLEVASTVLCRITPEIVLLTWVTLSHASSSP
jgi:hypothetical protein